MDPIYTTLLGNIRDSAYIVDREDNILYINPAMERLTGWRRKDVLGKKSHEIFGETHRHSSIDLSAEKEASPDISAFSVEAQPDIRLLKSMKFTRAPIQRDERVEGVLVVMKESVVTATTAEDAELYRMMIEKTADPVFLIDIEDGFRMAYVNEAAVKHYGAPREEILTWRIPDWDPNFVMDDLPAHLEDMRKNPGLIIETEHRVKGGRLVPVELSLNLITYKGRLCHFGYVKDISERKITEMTLRDSAKEIEDLYNHAPCGYQSLDRDGKILRMNDTQLTWLGFSAKEVLGKHYSQFLSEESALTFERSFSEFIKKGRVDDLELELICKDGSYIPVLLSATAIKDEKGHFISSRATVYDIRKRKEVVNQLIKAKEEAERANQAKSQFLAGMSHELRTPMNSILGFSQLMESDTDTPLSEEHRDYVGHILKSGRHLLELIDEVLDLSKIESGKMLISMEAVDLGQTIQAILPLVERMASDRHITIENCYRENGIFAQVDLTRFKQVILNLLSNAIKYNRENGKVIINCGDAGDKFWFSVEDTGIGISEQNLQKIFQPFNRLGAEESAIEGTGIGLTITKRLVELMGGSIRVESEVGKGTKFFVELEKAKMETAKSSATVESAKGGTHVQDDLEKSTVLYVEDNPINLKLVANILKRYPNIELISAPDAKIGIEMALKYCPDLILLDINLPGMNGVDAMKQLKLHEQTEGIPVVAVSANAMPRDIEAAKAAGFTEYVTKPIDVSRFMQIVSDILKF